MYRIAAVALAIPMAYVAMCICRRYFGGPSSIWFLMLGMTVVAASAALRAPVGPILALSLLLGWALLTLGLIDSRIYRLPDPLTLPLVAAGLAGAAFFQPDQLTARLIGSVGGYAALAAAALIFRWLRGRDGLGLGDAKLLAASGAWLGWRMLPNVLLLASLGGLAWVFVSHRINGHDRNTPLPFGPFLALASWICWLVSVGA